MLENIKQKKGISLIVLVITIIVTIILVSVTAVAVGDSVANANIAAFASDLSTIQENVETYYIQNNDFPIQDGTTALSEAQIIALARRSK